MQHTHISAKHELFDLKLGELWRYRDLVWLFTKRSFVVTYKQTILGPLWLVINPLLTSVMHLVLFSGIAGLSTDGAPELLFYLTGNAIWNFFSTCVSSNAYTFTGNAGLFGKVYFPRLTMPVSVLLSNGVRFGIQMLPVLVLLLWYTLRGALQPHWGAWLLLPLLLAQLGLMGLGVGILISSLTTKYRDLGVLVGFGMSLWMYATPVVYPLSAVSDELRRLLCINPVTAPVEFFRWAVLGIGSVDYTALAVSCGVTLLVTLLGIVVFNKVERTFMDTV